MLWIFGHCHHHRCLLIPMCEHYRKVLKTYTSADVFILYYGSLPVHYLFTPSCLQLRKGVKVYNLCKNVPQHDAPCQGHINKYSTVWLLVLAVKVCLGPTNHKEPIKGIPHHVITMSALM